MSVLGKYRNGQGVELEVIGPCMARNILGTMYEAVIPDQLFGPRHYICTPEGLAECGYVKMEASA